MHIKKIIFLFLLLPTACLAQTFADSISSRIQLVENSLSPTVIYGDSIAPQLNLEERMKATGIKGLSIAVIRNYKIEWAKGYGWADEAAGRKVTTSTRFQAASISKSLNSLGVLLLVQQGKLNPQADINQYLKRWKFPYDSLSGGKKINTYHLLSHTAGLGIHGFPGYKTTDSLPSLVQVLNGEKPANTRAVRSLFEPGKKFQYSGGGTTISQLLLEDITGKKYASYMQEKVLGPLGMTNSSYQQPPADAADRATGYYENGEPVKGNYHVYPEQAAAGLWTTPTDLAKYIIECQLALQGKSKKVLSQAMMQTRMRPYVDSSVALGVFIVKMGDKKFFNHNGGNEAFLCTSYGTLEGGNGVVIMINGENYAVISELLNSVDRVYNWNAFYKPDFRKKWQIPKDSLSAYTGKFLLNKDTIAVIMCGDQLCIQQNGQPVKGYEMIFSDATHFSIAEVQGAVFIVQRNTAGKIDAMELHQGGGVFKLPRIE